MKNLPEKIYLNLNMTPQEVVETKDKDFHEATKTWEITWSEECLSEHDPEYVRKDALIEKPAWTEEDKGWTLTRVWQVDHKLVVAKTIEDAIALFKTYMGEDFTREPRNVRAIGSDNYLVDYDALIKEE